MDSIFSKVNSYTNRARAQTDVQAAVQSYPTLRPVVSNLVREDGNESRLVCLEGTIPMYFGGAQYNLPINMWVTEYHPYSAPICFLTPTSNMIVKDRHRHVDKEGRVYHQYLTDWGEASSLVKLLHTLSQVFSEDPPLYAKSAAKPPPPPSSSVHPPPPPPSHAAAAAAAAAASGSGSGSGVAARHPHNMHVHVPTSSSSSFSSVSPSPAYVSPSPHVAYPGYGAPYAQPPAHSSPAVHYSPAPSPHVQQQQQQQQRELEERQLKRTEDDAAMVRREVAGKVAQRLAVFARDYHAEATKRMETLGIEEQSLLDKSAHMDQVVAQLRQMQTVLGDTLPALTAEDAAMREWIDRDRQYDGMSADQLVELSDEYSKQIVELVAADHAIEDALFVLQRAFQAGRLSLDAFMKHTRRLAREQFFKRAAARHLLQRRTAASLVPAAAPPR